MNSLPALLQTAQAHLNARRHAEAERICHQILKLDSRQPETMQVLALSLFFRGEKSEAIRWMRKAILIRPDSHQFYSILGTFSASAGNGAEAARYHLRSTELLPKNPDYLSNAGLAVMNIGKIEQAIELFNRALAGNPQHVITRLNLGLALQAAGDIDGSIKEFQQVVTLNPDYLLGWSNLTCAYTDRGEIDPAIAASRKAVALDPGDIAANQCLLMTMSYSQKIPFGEIIREHKNWGERYADPGELQNSAAHPVFGGRQGDRLRIGYVSTDFHKHPVVHFFEPILINHDRNQFEIFCYSSSKTVDSITRTLQQYPSQWRDILQLTNREAADLIRQDRIDILVDLNGHTAGSRITTFAHRPAPVQITYLGYNCTTGMRQVDYFLTDAILDRAGDDQYYTEQLLRLPRTFACYRPYLDAHEVTERPSEPITFISQHPLVRLNAAVIDLWARILRQVSDSRLIIARHTLTPVTEERLSREFAAHGINPSRLEMRKTYSSPQHLLNFNDADISLDTFPWSGHTTACESLWMGCPIVTLYGPSHAGRRVASVLTQLGLTDLITTSPEEYINTAVKLAGDSERRAFLRRNLRQIMRESPLMDAHTFTRNLEAVFKSIYERSAGKESA